MKRIANFLVFSLVLLLALPLAAVGGAAEQVAPTVGFFENTDGSGWAYGAPIPSSESTASFENDALSSVFIPDFSTVVVLYGDIDFGGASITLTGVGLHDLEALGFNDEVSSYEITSKGVFAGFYENVDGTGWAVERAVPFSEATAYFADNELSSVLISDLKTIVVLYEDADFGGRSLTLSRPGLHDLEALGFNDITSSYKVFQKDPFVGFYENVDGSGWAVEVGIPYEESTTYFADNELSSVLISDGNAVVVLYEDADFGGASVTIEGEGLHNLEALGFNDVVSSYQVLPK